MNPAGGFLPIQDFELKFFEHLKAEFEADYSQNKQPQADLARAIIERYQHSPESLITSDIYALELLFSACNQPSC